MEAAKAANDLEGQAEAALGAAAQSADQASWFEAAIKDFRTAGNRKAEANAMENLGYAYLGVGAPEKALDSFSQALPFRKELGDRKATAQTLLRIAYVHNALRHTAEAVDFYNQSIPILA